MKKLKQFVLAATMAIAAACGGVEGAEESGLEIETGQSAIIDEAPWLDPSPYGCSDHGQPCHVLSAPGGPRACYDGTIVCAYGSTPSYCTALGRQTTFEYGRCPRYPRLPEGGPEPHVPGGLSPR